jgi:ABC-type polysaccharide/polyol phosphate export permease
MDGRVAPFIELGVGFDPELPARANAVQSAVLFGLGRREAEDRVEDMLEFAELREFANQKLKNYSSGMSVRLAFAVLVHVDADILLCDEVLAVGDSGFRQRCFDHFERVRAEGKTIVLVTHDIAAVREHCDRALLLHRGRVAAVGDPDEIADRYERSSSEPLAAAAFPLTFPMAEPAPPRRKRLGAFRAAVDALALPSLLRPPTRRFATITRMLAVTDFKLKYFDATLSYFWALLRPAIFFGVLLVLFGLVGRFNDGVAHYPAYLVLGVALWTFFLQATTSSLYSLRQRAPLLRKLPFPRLAVPLSTVVAASFDLVLNLVVAFAFVLAAGITPRASWLELVPLVGLVCALALGFSLLLSAVYVRHRDLDQLWSVAGQALFFFTPVFYVVTTLPQPFERILLLANPLATTLTEVRHAVIDAHAPSAATLAGGYEFLLIPLGVVVGIAALGVWAFRHESPKAAEYV